MLNLGSKKLPPVLKFLVFPIIFETTTGVLRQGHFLDLHVIAFVKTDQITISFAIISSINWWSLYNLKKVSNRQSDVHITIKYVFIFPPVIRSQKIDVRLNKTLNSDLDEYKNILVMGDLNSEVNENCLNGFCNINSLKTLIRDRTCVKNLNNPSCIDLCWKLLSNLPSEDYLLINRFLIKK